MDLDDALRCALDGDAMLFTGAGLSFLSKNGAGDCLPDGNKLKDLLLGQGMEIGSHHPLDRVAGHAIRNRGVDFVADLLKKNLTVVDIDTRLERVYQIPWRRIYTTNYDNAAEYSRRNDLSVSTIVMDDELAAACPGSIIHINGYIGKLTPANIQNEFSLTDYSYATSKLTESDWFRYFLRDIKTAKAIIFVGYSLYDLDIARALVADEAISRKTFFFISPSADEIEQGAISQYGKVEAGGFIALSNAIARIEIDYKVSPLPPVFVALDEIIVKNPDNESTNAQKLYNQLVYGRLQESEFLQDDTVFASQKYLVNRKQDRDVVASLKKGPWRDVLYIGELASGKTTSCLVLAKALISMGYRVYYARHGITLTDELAILSKNKEKAAVIFEDYASLTSEIRDFASRRHQDQRIILTARSVSHQFVADFLDKTPHLGPTHEVVLDKIDESDVAEFEALVNFGGFWGDKAGASEVSRQRMISNKLEGSLYKLLIEIVESEKVQLDVSTLLSPLKFDRRAQKLFVSSFIVNVLGLQFSVNDWQTVFESNWVRRIMRTYRDQVQNFLSMSGDSIFPRAGVLSSHILRTFQDDSLIRECMVALYERAIRSEETDDDFKQLRFKLTRYGAIESLFSEKNKSNNISRYYDDIRVFGNTRNNPDYWLQVGIAATIHDDLTRAGLAFENAYARERSKRSPNLKKIDNYFSRYQMRLAVVENDPGEAFAIFIRASERLKQQMFIETDRHFPYKTGRHYTDVAAKHYGKWTDTQKEQFIIHSREIRDRAFEWKDSGNDYSLDVEILIKETTILLERLAPN